MKNKLLLVYILFFSMSCYPHHGTFTYDGNIIVTIEGVVKAFNYTNPHGSIILETVEGDYEIETDGPSLIALMGVNRNSLEPGERIIAYVSPSTTSRQHEVLGREVIREDGSVVRISVRYAREREAARQVVADSVLGTWVPERSTLFDYVASSSHWPLTEKGQASSDAYDVTEPFSHTQCIAATAPTLMMYPTANVLEEVNGNIEINADWMGATRIVYMDGREHPPAESVFYQGHSVGHWEGNTLVINTENFEINPIGNIFSIDSGIGKTLEERISLNPDGFSASYTYILSDPDYLTAPVTGTFQWQYRPDVSVSSVPCDPEAASEYLERL